MSLGISAAGWAAIGTMAVGAYSANEQQNAAAAASQGQQDAAAGGIAEQRRQFDAVRELLQPYVDAGGGSLTAQRALLGLAGGPAQSAELAALQASPEFAALTQQGEEAILANASATGGLRGGNTQGALAQFRPQMLAQLIADRYSRLSGLTSLGQNAAAGLGNAGMATGGNVAALLQQQGAALAGGALAGGRAAAGLANSFGQGIGLYGGLGGFGRVGGTAQPSGGSTMDAYGREQGWW